MSNPSGRFSVAAAAVVLLSAATTHALELDWHAPAGCPDAASVKRHVQRLAGVAEGASLLAKAVVTQTTAQRWRVSINLSGSATGHRTLTADTCPQLARASALIIALAANPEAALDLPSDEQPSPSTPAPAQSARSAAPSSVEPQPHRAEPERPKPALPSDVEPERQKPQAHRAPEPARQRPLPRPQPQSRLVEKDPPPTRAPESLDSDSSEGEPPISASRHLARGIDVFARIGFERGALPTDTGWLGLGVRLRSSRLPLSFSLAAFGTQGTSATFTNGIGADFRLLAGQALLCLQPNTHRWFIAGCGGVQLSVTRAAGFIRSVGVDSNVQAGEYFVRYRWTPAPLFALGLGYHVLPPLMAEVGGGIALPLQRLTYVVENVGILARPERQQMLLYAGIGLTF